MATLSGFFGLIALALAVVGVYGVVSYTAASRQREIGIRLALGARAADVMRTVLLRMAVTGGVGLAAGLVLRSRSARPPRRCSTASSRVIRGSSR